MRRLPLAALSFVAVLLLLAATPSTAQDRSDMLPRTSPNATVSQTIGVTDVTITYGRPSVRDRTIFGDLVPLGEVWRTGANEATTISFSTPVQVEGEPLDAGTYGLFTIPGEQTWTIIFNETAEQWGAYNYDSSQDALRVDVDAETGSTAEMMTFNIRSVTDTAATVVLHWADVVVPFDVTVDTPAQIVEQASAEIESTDDWRVPARYASYALQEGVAPEQAMTWVNASIEMEETFANLNVKARLQAAAGNHADAVATAEKALAMAESMDETPRGADQLASAVEQWKSNL